MSKKPYTPPRIEEVSATPDGELVMATSDAIEASAEYRVPSTECPACDSPSRPFGAVHGAEWCECIRCNTVWRSGEECRTAVDAHLGLPTMETAGRLRAGLSREQLNEIIPPIVSFVLTREGVHLAACRLERSYDYDPATMMYTFSDTMTKRPPDGRE